MGVGLFLFSIFTGGSFIKKKYDDYQMMKTPAGKLKDGTPVYYDSEFKEYINGERVIPKWNSELERIQYVGKNSKRVYRDDIQDKIDENKKLENKINEFSKENNLLLMVRYKYVKENFSGKQHVWNFVESNTGKIIYHVGYNWERYYCRKYYKNDIYDYYGEPISKSEYDKIIKCESIFLEKFNFYMPNFDTNLTVGYGLHRDPHKGIRIAETEEEKWELNKIIEKERWDNKYQVEIGLDSLRDGRISEFEFDRKYGELYKRYVNGEFDTEEERKKREWHKKCEDVYQKMIEAKRQRENNKK